MKKNALLVLALAAIPLVACGNNNPTETTSRAEGLSVSSAASGEETSVSESASAADTKQQETTAEGESVTEDSEQSQGTQTSETQSQGGETTESQGDSGEQGSEGSDQISEGSEEQSQGSQGSDQISEGSEEQSQGGEDLDLKDTIVWANVFSEDTLLNTYSTSNVKLTFAKGGGSNDPKYYENGKNARLYSGNTLTIEGKGITSIAINLDPKTQTDKIGYFVADVGNLNTSSDKFSATWSGNADKIVLTVAEKQCRILDMTFVVSEPGGFTPDVPEEEETLEEGTVLEMAIAFLAKRGVVVNTIPGIDQLDDELVLNLDYMLYFDGEYIPYFEVVYDGDVSETVLDALSDAEFVVPEVMDEEYGYECYNDDYEVDVYPDSDEEGSLTYIDIYALADFE